MNWSSPEIVEKDILKWHVRSQIPVVLDGADVIKHEAALQTVVVAHNAGDEDHGAEHQPGSHPPLRLYV